MTRCCALWSVAEGRRKRCVRRSISHNARSAKSPLSLSAQRLQTPSLRQVSVEGPRYLRPMHYYHLLRHPAGLALVGGLATLDLVSRALLRTPHGGGHR